MAAWLVQFRGRHGAFDWDAGNQTKGQKHKVEEADIEALFQRPIVFIGRIVEPIHPEARRLLLGQDSQERFLALLFTCRAQRLRPISCRPMRRNERRMYDQAIE